LSVLYHPGVLVFRKQGAESRERQASSSRGFPRAWDAPGRGRRLVA
jgi:hypothetical protein